MVLGRCAAALLALAVGGCGVIYTTPFVSEDGVAGGIGDTDYDVEVVRLTPERARAANLAEYVPPRLPFAFQPGALEDRVGEVPPLPELGPLPDYTVPPYDAPGEIEERFPPLIDPPPYRIGRTDVLIIAVQTAGTQLQDLPALISAQAKREGYIVQDDGAIAVPDVGRIRVAGLTLEEAEAAIFEALVRAGIDPSFTLEVAEFNSQKVSVSGDGIATQLLPIGLSPLYLHEAIQRAGGVQVLDPSVVKVVLRRDGEVYQLGLETLRTNPDAREIVLIDGDQVQVQSTLPQDLAQTRRGQELEQRQLRVAEADYALRKRNREAEQEGVEASRLERERALFRERLEFGAVERDYAFIAGEVGGARRFPLPFENPATLSDLLLNGTPLNITTADYGAIYVIRAARDPALQDKLTAYHLDAENAVNLMIATEFELRPNDVVFVSEQPITRWNRAISQVLPNIFRAVSLATLGNGL